MEAESNINNTEQSRFVNTGGQNQAAWMQDTEKRYRENKNPLQHVCSINFHWKKRKYSGGSREVLRGNNNKASEREAN